MRVITWNMRRATKESKAWDILFDLKPDIALLQEVSSFPPCITNEYEAEFRFATNKDGGLQKFGTMLMVKGKILEQSVLTSEYYWVNKELERYSGNLLHCKVELKNKELLNLVSVYSPAWPVDTSRYSDEQVNQIKLKQNPKLWVTELLWAGLKNSNLRFGSWIVAGDFNSSETFDYTFSSGNKEILDRMHELGFTECLRKYKGELTPTFKISTGGKIIHQIDHLFVNEPIAQKLNNCAVGSDLNVFEESISDHLPIIADLEN